MLVKFNKDEIVSPRASEQFGQFNSGKKNSQPLKETDFYKNDVLGLKTLDDKKKLFLVDIDGKHTKYTDDDISKTFLPFLKK